MADSLREIGYACTSDKDRCRQTLTQLGGVREVTAKAVAQVISHYYIMCIAQRWVQIRDDSNI